LVNEFSYKNVISRWDKDSQLSRLPGEYDLNFRVSGNTTGILKIMRENCDRSFIETQVAMMNHLSLAGNLPVPHVIPSTDGNEIESVDLDGENRLAWMINLLPGDTLAMSSPIGLPLMRDIGVSLGRVQIALRDFVHPGLNREFKWDLTAADYFVPHIDEIQGSERVALVSKIFDEYTNRYQSFLQSLPRQALHNDMNDHNILVTIDKNGGGLVTGLIDFGDIVYGPVLADVAIAGAYFVLNCDDPIERLAAFLGGYQSVQPLSEDEVDAVWPLALTRLAASVTNAAVMKKEKPDDPYVVVTEVAAWQLLDRLAEFDADSIRRKLHQASNAE